MLYKIAYKVCDDKTKKRIGFILSSELYSETRLCTVEEAAYLAYNGRLEGVSAKMVHGKPVLIGHGDSILQNVKEISLSEAKSIIGEFNKQHNITKSSIDSDRVFLVNRFTLLGKDARIASIHASIVKQENLPMLEYKGKENLDFLYSFVSDADIQLFGRSIKAGNVFLVKRTQLQELLKAFGDKRSFGNGFIAIGEDGSLSVASTDINVNNINVGYLLAQKHTYVCDSRFKDIFDMDFFNSCDIVMGDKIVSKVGSLSYRVVFEGEEAYTTNGINYIFEDADSVEQALSPKVPKDKMNLFNAQSMGEASKRATGVNVWGRITDDKAFKKGSQHTQETKRGLRGLINMFNR